MYVRLADGLEHLVSVRGNSAVVECARLDLLYLLGSSSSALIPDHTRAQSSTFSPTSTTIFNYVRSATQHV